MLLNQTDTRSCHHEQCLFKSTGLFGPMHLFLTSFCLFATIQERTGQTVKKITPMNCHRHWSHPTASLTWQEKPHLTNEQFFIPSSFNKITLSLWDAKKKKKKKKLIIRGDQKSELLGRVLVPCLKKDNIKFKEGTRKGS